MNKFERLTRSAKDYVEIKTVDTNGWIVLDSQVNVFLDAESKVSGAREVLFTQLVLSYLQQSKIYFLLI